MAVTFAEKVATEREQQRERWGDDHDDRHNLNDWSHILLLLAGKFAREVEDEDGPRPAPLPWPDRMQWRLVKLAATCQAAYEAIERNTDPAPPAREGIER